MGTMFRSERMVLLQVLERNDAARDVVNALGELGCMQLRDMMEGTPYHKRTFSDEARRCGELKRLIDKLHKHLETSNMKLWPRDPSANLVSIDELDGQLRSLYEDLKTQVHQETNVVRAQNALKEHLAVLKLGSDVYVGSGLPEVMSAGEAEAGGQIALGMQAPLITNGFGTGSSDEGLLRFVAGTVPRASSLSFEKIAYRMARGNCVVHSLPIEEPMLSADTKEGLSYVPKNVVLVFFSGSVLHAKLLKICAHFGVSVYNFPESASSREATQARLLTELEDASEVVEVTRRQKKYALQSVAHQCEYWRYVCEREMATLHALNLLSFDMKNRVVFVAEGWVPISRVPEVRAVLDTTASSAGRTTQPIINVLESRETPPTHLPTNKFTAGFQGLVNTYGFPRYREVNPGAFAIVCFPFLFAIMFGDVGHGSLLLLLALFLIKNEEKMGKEKLDDIVGMVFGGRYVLLLNAVFAIYVGFIYNEAFAVPLGLFGSSWIRPDETSSSSFAQWEGYVVPFGIDPAWHRATNKMTFFNSYKMKVAIVFGVAQMTLGISLSLLNHIEFRDMRSVWFQFVPELVFFLSIFGYLVLMILMKWATDWGLAKKQPPSLLNVLISMFMSPGTYTEEDRLFENQEQLQLVLMVVALLAVPLLLIPKPLLAYLDSRKKQAYATVPPAAGSIEITHARSGDDAEADADEEEEEGEHDEDLSEVVVHQVIHTIEFVLGSISNTASYLRLWALSLAHSQLSELFWEKVMVGIALAPGVPFPFNGIVTFLAFAVWVVLHLGVLMVMENLSSFLHALRLQWVEFQNKFYNGDGKPFTPFSYELIGNDNEE